MLLTEIDVNDEDFKDYKFSIKDLELKSNRKWQSKQLKTSIKSLMSKPLEIKNENGWEIVNWFSYFKYENNGLITCRFDKRLKPLLLNLKKQYVLSTLKNILPMRSSYSKRIYLLLKEYEKIGSRKFEITELQTLLKVPKSLLIYNRFKEKVLSKAKEDINKFTDIKIDFKENKLARKVNSVTFTIKKNDENFRGFIKLIRELYVNTPLIKYNNHLLMCAKDGLLYEADTLRTLTKAEAEQVWNYLFNNKDELMKQWQPSIKQYH
jgi:plasmid replication initiation protein